MEINWKTALRDSISNTFSTMFFLVPNEISEESAELGGTEAAGWVEASLEIKGEGQSLKFLVWSPPDLARELAANILCCESDEIEPGDLMDAYREMMNMVTGSLLTAIDQATLWTMGLPKAETLGEGGLNNRFKTADELVFFEIEEYPLIAGWKAQPR